MDTPDSDPGSETQEAITQSEIEGATLVRSPAELYAVEVGAPDLRPMEFAQRYEQESLLGEGGMGVVRLFLDRQIGRRVAIKVVRRRVDPEARARFVREARVQGQLEHPAVVPVYDLGVTPDGAQYFSMKRIRGTTLEDVIQKLREHDTDVHARFTRRRLLTAFNSACLAVDFAHERGVVHRDLKPSNVMLGDFGEVYVLDWGLAKILSGTSDEVTGRRRLSDIRIVGGETVDGAVMGTPGYMAPEQLAGDVDRIGPVTDVYALGAILFEILTFERLHAGRSIKSIVDSTVGGVSARPSARFPDIPPELETIILRATETDPDDRFQSARELSEALERYLDGERDVEQRREMAERHARAAQEAVERARTEKSPTFNERRRAMREIGRALALDPNNQHALDSMVQLLSEPPERLPYEVRLSIESNDRHKLRWFCKAGALAYASFFVYLPLLLWVGVRNWTPVLAVYALAVLASSISLWAGFRRDPPQWSVLAVLSVSTVLFMSTTIFFGPLVLPPLLLAINTVVFNLYLPPRYRLLSIATGVIAVLIPNLMWLAGLGPGYRVTQTTIQFVSPVLELSPMPIVVLVIGAAVGAVVTGAYVVTQVRDALARTEQQIFLYAWHLRELVPEAVRAPTDPTPARRASLPAEARM